MAVAEVLRSATPPETARRSAGDPGAAAARDGADQGDHGADRARAGQPGGLPGGGQDANSPSRSCAASAVEARRPVAAVGRDRRGDGGRGRPAGPTRRAGLVALAVDSTVVNVGFKLAARRRRPDRDTAGVPTLRHVPMPDSASFPSGHAAAGFAFANAVGQTLPTAAAPLRLLASVVGYSRVHTGVHYAGDVVTGAVIGATVGELVRMGAGAAAPTRPAPGERRGPPRSWPPGGWQTGRPPTGHSAGPGTRFC